MIRIYRFDTVNEYIRDKIITIARHKILQSDRTVSEITSQLGFKYPQHFSRMFKSETGYKPNEYRSMN